MSLVGVLTCVLVIILPRFSFATYIEGHDSVAVGSWFSFITESESDSVNGNFRVIASSDILGVNGTVYINEKGRWADTYGFDGVRESPDDTTTWSGALIIVSFPPVFPPLWCADTTCHCISDNAPLIVSVKKGKFSKLKLTCFRNGFVFFDWGYQDDSTLLFYNTNSIKNNRVQGNFNKTPSTEMVIYDLKGRIIWRVNQYTNYSFLPSGVYLIRNERNGCFYYKLIGNIR
jgi:hypothetical protein